VLVDGVCALCPHNITLTYNGVPGRRGSRDVCDMCTFDLVSYMCRVCPLSLTRICHTVCTCPPGQVIDDDMPECRGVGGFERWRATASFEYAGLCVGCVE
jgi:hypothetical protein